ncbi:hypothetical protein U9M48_023357 [Paspalum notatum var. saurae]|uniref:Uncharacterized protein n=1 Tax=Paspalum notatum var. saurae TaxID=547442 RepID=A0AAQ3TKI8_PASNO
MDQRRRSR